MFPRVSFSAALPIGLMSALGALVLIATPASIPLALVSSVALGICISDLVCAPSR